MFRRLYMQNKGGDIFLSVWTSLLIKFTSLCFFNFILAPGQLFVQNMKSNFPNYISLGSLLFVSMGFEELIWSVLYIICLFWIKRSIPFILNVRLKCPHILNSSVLYLNFFPCGLEDFQSFFGIHCHHYHDFIWVLHLLKNNFVCSQHFIRLLLHCCCFCALLISLVTSCSIFRNKCVP